MIARRRECVSAQNRRDRQFQLLQHGTEGQVSGLFWVRPGTLVALARGRGTRLMRNAMPGKLRARCTRCIAWSVAVAMLVVAGCTQLAEKERELTFRVVPGTASWFGGVPAGVQESDLLVDADGKPQRIHAWWWAAAKQDVPAGLYLHRNRWELTGQ